MPQKRNNKKNIYVKEKITEKYDKEPVTCIFFHTGPVVQTGK